MRPSDGCETSVSEPTRERYEIVDSSYTADASYSLFFELPKQATVFVTLSSLDGAPLSAFTLPEADVRTLAQDPGSAPTIQDRTFTGVTEASGQADLEAREWAIVIRPASPAAEEDPREFRFHGEPREFRFHGSLHVAWIGGPPGG